MSRRAAAPTAPAPARSIARGSGFTGSGSGFRFRFAVPRVRVRDLRDPRDPRTRTRRRARRQPRTPPTSRSPERLRVATGSTSRYPSSPSRLPALLAAYRKYGSLAFGSFVRENHCCRSGAVADSAKNGRPTVHGQCPKQPPPWTGAAGLSDLNRHRQRDARDDQHADVHRPLPPRRHTCAQRMGVEISEQQHGLEEDHAGAPDRRAAAEHRKQHLRLRAAAP